MKKLVTGFAVLGFVAGLSPALADGDLPEGLEGYRLTGESETCVSTTRIESTSALDDRNIVFEMNGNKTYLNRLLNSCPQLGFEDSFMYEISGTQLCRGDIITVLEQGTRGASCSLGGFELLEELPEEGDEGDEGDGE